MNTASIAESLETSSTLKDFREISREYRLDLVFGLVIKQGDKAANTLIHLSPTNDVLTQYTKIHPFTPAGEDRFFVGGKTLATASRGEFTFGYTICYDLRFPEIFSALAKKSNVIVNIANWPKRRLTHWRTLLQARAIENQIYVIGVNRTGTDGNGLKYERSSGIVNANGEFVDPIATEGEIDIYEMSLQELLDFRRGFSTRQDRLPDLYRTLI
jgi:omega-amidase